MTRLAIAIITVTVLLAQVAYAGWACPSNAPPSLPDTPNKCPNPSLAGDPVAISGDNPFSFHRAADFTIRTGTGAFPFYRTYVSANETWFGVNQYTCTTPTLANNHLLADGSLPAPFGQSPSDATTLRWTHNLFSFVDVRAGLPACTTPSWRVRQVDGQEADFAPVTTGVASWANHTSNADSPGEESRLWYDPSGPTLKHFRADGMAFRYATPYTLPGAGAVTHYFLTDAYDFEGRHLLTVNYALPNVGGPTCRGASSNGAPYVSSVVFDAGPTLNFHYTYMPAGTGLGNDCALTSIDSTLGGGSPQTASDYLYWNGVSGLLSQATSRLASGGTDFAETYGYTGGTFTVSRNQFQTVNHDAVHVTQSTDLSGVRTFSTALGSGATQDYDSICQFQDQRSQTVVETSAMAGDGVNTVPFQQVSSFGGGRGRGVHTRTLFYARTDSCGGSLACSPGDVVVHSSRPENGTSNNCGQLSGPYNPLVQSATKNKLGNWTVTPVAVSSGTATNLNAPLYAFERTGLLKGATDAVGTGALETVRVKYGYNAGYQATTEVVKPSFVANADAGTLFFQDAANSAAPNRMLASIKYGQTKDVTGTLVGQSYARFYRTTQMCGSKSDTHGRTLLVKGPCVPNAAKTDCAAATAPITEFEYYDDAFPGPDRGFLFKMTQYPNGCASTPLTTTYNGYNQLGMPGSVVENDLQTNYTYAGSKVATRTIGTKVWTYAYDDDKLVAAGTPDGLYDVFCYRSGIPLGGACTAANGGVWTGRLQYRVKAGAPDGTAWTERTDYVYWADGTLEMEQSSVPKNGSQIDKDVRLERLYSRDAQKRLTLEWSANDPTFAVKRAYDGADNLVGIGQNNSAGVPANYCNSGGSFDNKCAHLYYDKADRLATVDRFASSVSGTGTQLQYDAHGNVISVRRGCATGGGTCAIGPSTLADAYLFDDFDNLIQISLAASTGSGGAGSGVERLTYDAMGNVLTRETEQMRAAGNRLNYSYDMLGRLTLVQAAVFPYTVFLQNYWDTGSGPQSTLCAPIPTLNHTLGRIATAKDPVWWTFYQYDGEGNIVGEFRQRSLCEGVGNNLSTIYGYSQDNVLTSITYPHGRKITYLLGSGGAAERVVSVKMTYMQSNGLWSADTPIIDSVAWEPFGGLRGYVTHSPTGTNQPATVEYVMGAAGALGATACPTNYGLGTNDATGRLRALRVSSGAQPYGAPAGGDIYRKFYQWAGSQIATIDTCYRTMSTSQRENFTYDWAGRLTDGSYPNAGVAGGPSYAHYAIDARDNITQSNVAAGAYYSFTGTGTGGSLVGDRVTSVTSNYGNGIGWTYGYDMDGNVTSKATPTDSSGTAGATWSFAFDTGSAYQSVFRAANVSDSSNPGWYSYYYDGSSRRTKKTNPLGVSDDYFYDLGHQMLEDRGNVGINGGTPYPIDEYVWLGGRPVMVVRGSLNASHVHQQDFVGTCAREGDSVSTTPCQAYFVVTDHVGRPVLALTPTLAIAGGGEYDPYHNLNFLPWWGYTLHPYANSTSSYWSGLVEPALSTMSTQFRAYFPIADTEVCGSTQLDWLQLENQSTGTPLEATKYGGYAAGNVWTNWVSPPANVATRIHFSSNTLNKPPGLTPPQCFISRNPGWNYYGATFTGFEYRRFDTGTTPYWIPFRGAGQYFDKETGVFENWNRYYEPLLGRYLSPEPLLQTPRYVRAMARRGLSTPSYAYALNNPQANVDVDGRGPRGWAKAIALALKLLSHEEGTLISKVPERLEEQAEKASKARSPKGTKGGCGAGGSPPEPFTGDDLIDLMLPPFVLTPRDYREAGVNTDPRYWLEPPGLT